MWFFVLLAIGMELPLGVFYHLNFLFNLILRFRFLCCESLMKTAHQSPAPASSLTPSVSSLPPSASTHYDPARLVFPIVAAVGFAHLLNDLIQAILPAIYPMLKEQYLLSFTQVGLITLIFQITASLLQPAIGLYTDKHPKP